MRHSDIDLTMNVYTDPKLLGVPGALDALPMLPLNNGQADMAEAARATGTDDLRQSSLAPNAFTNFRQTGTKAVIRCQNGRGRRVSMVGKGI